MAFRIFGFRPALWPTLIMVPALAVTFGLGVWQLHRLTWKEGLIAQRQHRSSMAPLDGLPKRFDPARDAFRRVKVTGTFVHDKELLRPARSMKEGAIGFQVFTPMKLADGSYVFIERGWVPTQRELPDARRQGQVKGEVTVEGLLRAPPTPGYFVPDNNPAKNRWFRINIAQMAKAVGLGPFKPFFIDAGTKPNPGGYPVGGQTRLTLRNAHLEYAITWFALCFIGIVIYVLYHRRREKTQEQA
jgi:surfeit locus 1 family protein